MVRYDSERFFDLSLDLLCIASMDGYFKRINHSFTRVLGWPRSELMRKPFLAFVHPDDQPCTLEAMAALAEGTAVEEHENRYLCADGSFKQLMWTAYPDTAAGLIYSVARDVTEQRQIEQQLRDQARELDRANKKLQALATRDPLTNLANRRHFDDRLTYLLRLERRRRKRLSLMLLDVDHFKHFNDRYGHSAGDTVLRTVAKVLVNSVRDSDIVSRYGGEEFAIILPDTGLEDSEHLAERCRCSIERENGAASALTISLGLATVAVEDFQGRIDTLAKSLVNQADQALYAAKAQGRNQCVHFARLGQSSASPMN